MAFPVLLLAIMLGSTVSGKLDHVALGGALNEGVISLVLLIGLFTWFYPARIVRSLIFSLRGREFVLAPLPYNPAPFSAWLTIIPSVTIFLTALALTLLGEGLLEAFDPWEIR
jgi:ABC-type dipeptide/oligopeptide/nickel transport system permease subunit